jgi:hypothetical protein
MAQPLALGAELVLGRRLEAVRVLDEGAELGHPRLGGRRVLPQLVLATARGGQLAPGGAERGAALLLLVAGEGVEHVELVGGPRETALLELARHRDQSFCRGGDVLAGGAAAPDIGARAAVREDAAREDEAVLVLWPQLGDRRQVVVEERGRRVELGLHVGVVAVRPDERGFAARAQQQPDRLGEDRLARARLARDGVETRPEGELRPPDEDEVLDAEAPEHAWMLRPRAARGETRKATGAAAVPSVHARAPGRVGVRDGTGPRRTSV